LHSLGFRVLGWSRSVRTVTGAECFSGRAELPFFLNSLDVLVCLLPLTEETRGILDRDLFAQLPRGASIINVGRGGHLITADLIEALDAGQLSAAVLDVAEPEPLPRDHAFWAHPKILLTPHTASMTRPETGADFVLETIGRHRRGEPLPGLVDRQRGY
jgi:glyoxylate/hydroxypyruvate reductase A